MRDETAHARSRFLPVLVGLYCVAALFVFRACQQRTQDLWIYPLDDTYIGMAMSKNFALHGVWGVTRHAFTSATSTPFYTLLIAILFRIFGVVAWMPLAVASAAGIAALFAAERVLRPCPPALRAGGLAAVCFLAPLPILGLIGMEHTLHIALVMLFVLRSMQLAAAPAATGVSLKSAVDMSGVSLDWKLAVITLLMVGTRYESLFLVAGAAAWFAAHRRFRLAVSLVALGAFPVLAYGLVSVLHGWYWLPASVAIKGAHMEMTRKALSAIFYRLLLNIYLARDLAGLVAVLIVCTAYRYRRLSPSTRHVAVITALAWLMHMAVAQVGATYRYEGYLIALVTVAVALVANEYRDARTAEQVVVTLVVLIAVAPLSLCFAAAATNLPRASHAVWSQQYQMAQFLHRYYDGAGVAANDIGAINFFADLDCLDVAGLGNNGTFRAWYAQQPVLPVIEQEARQRHVRVAVIYEAWFPQVPQGWVRAGSWKVADRANLGSDIVVFYAVGEEEVPRLKQALVEFAAIMPRGEQVFIY